MVADNRHRPLTAELRKKLVSERCDEPDGVPVMR